MQRVSQLNQEGDGLMDGQADSSSRTLSASQGRGLGDGLHWRQQSESGYSTDVFPCAANMGFQGDVVKEDFAGPFPDKAALFPGLSELGRTGSCSTTLEEHFRALGPVLCVPSLDWRLGKDCWLLSLTELRAWVLQFQSDNLWMLGQREGKKVS